ncbi:hypothetical protein KM043_007292 [Ampulex compressa]|nr:hypothetical protein KM043_007292 [Ampulex compressa]
MTSHRERKSVPSTFDPGLQSALLRDARPLAKRTEGEFESRGEELRWVDSRLDMATSSKTGSGADPEEGRGFEKEESPPAKAPPS